ncbi:MAG TPA: transglutaminase-like cysteine peptidase [Methanosarcinales archaeon]|nr:transglutaminase-like cysteine peptidase [Methanosarcinales archaeon]
MQKTLDKIYKLFTYKEEANDHWHCWADEVERGIPFTDDCDGFAVTCAELLKRKGVPNISLIICLTGGKGHLVCGVTDKDTTWILDNNHRIPRDWIGLPYTWKYKMDLEDPGKWHSISSA